MAVAGEPIRSPEFINACQDSSTDKGRFMFVPFALL